MKAKNAYAYNRAPLHPTPFVDLPVGAIKPAGWLRDQLKIQAEGFGGRLPDYWDDLNSESGWLGGSGESWERGPYYLDGLVPLAYALDSEPLKEQARPWIEWTLNSQTADGQFGPKSNDDWWCRMVMLKVLAQYHEATGDDRVIPFMTKYFQYQAQNIEGRPLVAWGKSRGAENIIVLHWLYNRTGDKFLLDLAEKIHQQSIDWTDIFTRFPYWRYQTRFDHRIHVVNVAMALKEPAVFAQQSGAAKHRDAPRKGIDSLMTHHGQLHGMWSGDEWLAGTHPSQGLELCAVVEYMYTLEHLIRILGAAEYGDILERVAFNALPATIAADWCSHQYVQQVNQVRCTLEQRNWTENRADANMFGLEPNFGCCTANMHQGWPKFTTHLWMATSDAGLAAISYAPCTVHAIVADSVQVRVNVETAYPFEEVVRISVSPAKPVSFPLKLRVPGWCSSPALAINGLSYEIGSHDGFVVLEQTWQEGDQIVLTLPMTIRIERRANDAVGVLRGPLLFALPVKERWYKRSGNLPFANWEVYPQSEWNYSLQLDSADPNASFQVEVSQSLARQPFSGDGAPIRLRATGRRVPEWQLEMNSAGTPPISPVSTNEPLETLELLPYGSARLRIAEFPVVAE